MKNVKESCTSYGTYDTIFITSDSNINVERFLADHIFDNDSVNATV